MEEVNTALFDNPFLSNDLTSLNKEGMSKNFTHPKTWNKLTDTEKADYLNKKEFGQRTYFIYEGNPLFPEYTLGKKLKYKEIIDPKTQLPNLKKLKNNSQ